MKLETLTRYIETYGNITAKELKDIITKDKKESLINELESNKIIEFEHFGLWYYIFESETDAGYYIDIYEDEETMLEREESMNGGLCTGTAKDALEMFIEWDKVNNV